MTYKSEADTRITRTAIGDFSDYDGSGYVYDFDPMDTYANWEILMNKLNDLTDKNPYFDKSTRSFFISFTVFSPSTSMWVACEFLYEISVVGLVNPSYAIIKPFQPNLLETTSEKLLWGVEFLRLFCVIYIFIILIIQRVVKVKSLSKLFSIEIVISLLIDLAIVSFSITIFILVLILSSKSTQE